MPPPPPPDPHPDPAAAADRARRLAEAAGFAAVGIAPAAPSDHRAFIEAWLAAGRHGTMHYLTEHLEKRLDPRRLLPGARSVLCVADRYAAGPDPPPDPPPTPSDSRPRGRLARYGHGRDYHKVLKRRLFEIADRLREAWPAHTFLCATDTAPILEHEHATRAGIGFTGKHTLTIRPGTGSWLLLGQIVTTLALEPDPERRARSSPAAPPSSGGPEGTEAPAIFSETFPGCAGCTRCLDACPTDCLTPWAIDAGRCVSYLTIEHRGPIDPDLFEAMGDWVGGCDICQEVCPYNRRTPAAPPSHPDYDPDPERAAGIPLEAMIRWREADRQQAFAGSPFTRIKLEPARRNALIAAGNRLAREHDPALLAAVREAAAESEPPLVRQTARTVLARLRDAAG